MSLFQFIIPPSFLRPSHLSLTCLLAALVGLLPLAGCSRAADKPDGLYLVVSTIAIGGRINVLQKQFFFTPDGNVYDGVPVGGPDHFDWKRARQEQPGKTGTYELSDSEITYHWADGRTMKQKFAFLQNGFTLDGLFANPMTRFDAGQKLSGTYGASATMSAMATTLSNVKFLTFKPDGTFTGSTTTDVDVHGAMNSDPRLHTGTTGQHGDSGTYHCSGYTMDIKHADGRTEHVTGFPYGEKTDPKDAPGMLNIDGAMYTRSK